MDAVRNLFTIFDFPKSDWRRLQRTDFVRLGVETISTPRRTKFVRRDQWFYVISHLHNNRSYGRFKRTIKWRSALKRASYHIPGTSGVRPPAGIKLVLAQTAVLCYLSVFYFYFFFCRQSFELDDTYCEHFFKHLIFTFLLRLVISLKFLVRDLSEKPSKKWYDDYSGCGQTKSENSTEDPFWGCQPEPYTLLL